MLREEARDLRSATNGKGLGMAKDRRVIVVGSGPPGASQHPGDAWRLHLSRGALSLVGEDSFRIYHERKA